MTRHRPWPDPTGALLPAPRRPEPPPPPARAAPKRPGRAVVDLSAHRATRPATCPRCAGIWWRVEAVTLTAAGDVTGYTHPAWCVACGAERVTS